MNRRAFTAVLSASVVGLALGVAQHTRRLVVIEHWQGFPVLRYENLDEFFEDQRAGTVVNHYEHREHFAVGDIIVADIR